MDGQVQAIQQLNCLSLNITGRIVRPPEVDFVPVIQMLKLKCACQKAGKLSFLKKRGINEVVVPDGCCKARKLTGKI